MAEILTNLYRANLSLNLTEALESNFIRLEPRIKMNRADLVALMQNGNIPFSPSQKAICFPVVERIYRKMVKGIIIRKGFLQLE